MTSAQYIARVDELRLVDWRDNENRILHGLLFECFRQGVPEIRLTQKKDLELFLAGRELRNYLGAIDDLKSMGVLLWEQTTTGYLAAVREAIYWKVGTSRKAIDRVCYHRDLKGLIVHNRPDAQTPVLASQDPNVPSPFEENQSLKQTLNDLAPQGAAMQGLAGPGQTGSAERPQEQDRGCDEDAQKHQAPNRDSALGIAVRETERAVPAQAGTANSASVTAKGNGAQELETPPGCFPWRFQCSGCGKDTVLFWAERITRPEFPLCDGCRVLKFSTPGTEIQNRQKVPVLKFRSGKAESSEIQNPLNALNECNEMHFIKGEANGLEDPALATHNRDALLRVVRKHGASLLSEDALVHALRVVGAFHNPKDGGNSQKFWRDWADRAPTLVRKIIREDLAKAVAEQGWPWNVGGFLCTALKTELAKRKARP